MEKMGVKELTEVVDLALGLADLGIGVAKDKKVDVKDLGLLLSKAPGLIRDAVSAAEGIDKVPAELSDLSAEEASQLAAHVVVRLSVDDAKAKLIVEKALHAAVASYELGKAILS